MGNIIIKYITDGKEQQLTIEVDLSSDKVSDLKGKIGEKITVASETYHLTLNGVILKDDQTLKECGITAEKEIKLVLIDKERSQDRYGEIPTSPSSTQWNQSFILSPHSSVPNSNTKIIKVTLPNSKCTSIVARVGETSSAIKDSILAVVGASLGIRREDMVLMSGGKIVLDENFTINNESYLETLSDNGITVSSRPKCCKRPAVIACVVVSAVACAVFSASAVFTEHLCKLLGLEESVGIARGFSVGLAAVSFVAGILFLCCAIKPSNRIDCDHPTVSDQVILMHS